MFGSDIQYSQHKIDITNPEVQISGLNYYKIVDRWNSEMPQQTLALATCRKVLSGAVYKAL